MLSSKQEEFRRKTRNFLIREIAPSIVDYDLKEEFPLDNFNKLSNQGLMGLQVPIKYGGMGLGEIECGILLEELGRICSAHATIVGAHLGLCIAPILLFGSEVQKKKYLPRLSSGKIIGGFALTEWAAGSDVKNIQTVAEKVGSNFVLNGNKIFCTNGNRAGLVIVFAVTNNSRHPSRGVTAFLVERWMPGFSVGKVERKTGIRASTTVELVFDNCVVPDENILGHLGTGLRVALTALDGGRAGLAAGALGVAEQALDHSIDVMTNDKAKSSTVNRQSLQIMIADMAIEVVAARLMTYNTLHEVHEYFKRLAIGEKVLRSSRHHVSRNCSIVKAYVSEIASRAVRTALEIHAIEGLEVGQALERYFRDSSIAEIYEGTNEIQRLIIARDLLGLHSDKNGE
ncbi:MAG: acyl-CoA dehydrogenase family protein [Nitrososphaerales archaeon]